MRGHRWGAAALAAAGVLLALSACGGPRGFYNSGPPRVPAGGEFTIEPGQDVVVYGVRSQRCGMPPPSFETASGEMFAGEGSQAPEVGQVYDAGDGQRESALCGGTVPVRAIGYRPPEGFEGEVTMTFYGVDQATVIVRRPPEPEPEVEAEEAAPEPALDPAKPSEPAPLADPDVAPTTADGPVPEGESGPPEGPVIEPPGREPGS
jgi:hypothetical protein